MAVNASYANEQYDRSAFKRFCVNFLMPEGYCVKCKAKKEIAEGVEETMKNGRKAIKGKCPTCGVVMFKILGGKATPPAASTAPAATDNSSNLS